MSLRLQALARLSPAPVVPPIAPHTSHRIHPPRAAHAAAQGRPRAARRRGRPARLRLGRARRGEASRNIFGRVNQPRWRWRTWRRNVGTRRRGFCRAPTARLADRGDCPPATRCHLDSPRVLLRSALPQSDPDSAPLTPTGRTHAPEEVRQPQHRVRDLPRRLCRRRARYGTAVWSSLPPRRDRELVAGHEAFGKSREVSTARAHLTLGRPQCPVCRASVTGESSSPVLVPTEPPAGTEALPIIIAPLGDREGAARRGGAGASPVASGSVVTLESPLVGRSPSP